ncbi:methyltransferase-like protein [Aulographum hederae CBS 113979]|uniref:Methyltransferase-like protein n=1 Tax=Aulographum hederae CBS 113979 TaxID=1176131 RepID=A0A6G1H2G7_9PEZI|nr:methyltransferase-like protein [Aulographum hederae CBS 113979]
MATFAKSTFSHASYAAFRPSYPPSLYQTILTYHHGPKNLCLDLGTGHGLVARALAPSFKSMLGTDPSKGMIAQARQLTSTSEFPHVRYEEGSSENMPFVEGGSVDMVVAGQAAHWFDYPRLLPELARVVRKGGTLAFWGYKDHVFVDFPRATEVLHKHSHGAAGPGSLGTYWSQPGRNIVEGKLRAIEPPEDEWEEIERVEYEPGTQGKGSGQGTMFVHKKMRVDEVKDYMRTWSSVHGWQEANPGREKRKDGGKGDVVDEIWDEIVEAESGKGLDDDGMEIEIEWGTGLLMARKK